VYSSWFTFTIIAKHLTELSLTVATKSGNRTSFLDLFASGTKAKFYNELYGRW
jgi:hypothetical protein